MKKSIFFLSSILFPLLATAQWSRIYFDGNDTADWGVTMEIELDTSAANVWQVGMPQKTHFNAAYSAPNAIVTDTLTQYPTGAHSAFTLHMEIENMWYNVIAVQWMQRLDMVEGHAYGMVEYRPDPDSLWRNIFQSPYVYNLYGYEEANLDTLDSVGVVFTGSDSTWRNVWLCFDFWMLSDTFEVRYSFVSDSAAIAGDGWMLDNFLLHTTFVHTVGSEPEESPIEVFPNPTTGRTFIRTKTLEEIQTIRSIDVFDLAGRRIRHWNAGPSTFFVDLDDLPDGTYFMRVTTNLLSETFPIILHHAER